MLMKPLAIALIVGCCPTVTLAGTGAVEVGLVYLIDNADDVTGNWGNGIGARIGLTLAARSTASLHLVLDVTRHGYTGDNLFIMTPDIEGYRYQIDGEGATRFSLGGTIRRYGGTSGRSGSRGYIWIETAISLMDRGRIEFTDWMVGEPDSRHTRLIGESGQTNWSAQLGFGYGIPIGWWSATRPVLELGIRATSDSGVPQFPVSLAIALGGM
jgi:hypothetical protein